MFDLCCLTFGVGDWDNFRRFIDVPCSDRVFEWNAHLHLGTTDLTDFWGLKVWPPHVQS